MPTSTDLRTLAYRVTGAWETGVDKKNKTKPNYDAYQDMDKGIVSIGFLQFTLLSGNAGLVLNRYLMYRSLQYSSPSVIQPYMQQVQSRSPSLRNNAGFKAAFEECAQQGWMVRAQEDIADEKFWKIVYRDSFARRGLHSELAACFLFDTGIQHGVANVVIKRAEASLGWDSYHHVQDEEEEHKLITRAAVERDKILQQVAIDQNAPGVIARAKFWIEQTLADNWYMTSPTGKLTLKPGIEVYVGKS